MKYDSKWLEYYKFFRGKQWREQRPSYRHSEVINLVFQSIQTTVPIQTDARPRLEFIPRSPLDTDLADILNKVAEADWEKKNWLNVLTEIVYEQNFYGTGFGAMEVDPDGEDGLPSIEFRSKDPFYQFPDPSAYDINTSYGPQKSKYYIEAEPVDIEIVKKDYPEFAQWIKPDITDLTGGDKTNVDKIRFKSPVDNKTFLDTNTGYDITDRSRTLKITCYISPGEYESESVKSDIDPVADRPMASPGDKDPMGNAVDNPTQMEEETPPKPKNGRKIVMASGVLLSDDENPYDDREVPIAKLINYMLPREFWGISEIEQLMGPNKIYNKILSFTLDVMTLMGNPIWVVDSTSGIDTDNLFNRPGLIVEKEPGTKAERVEGVELQGYILPLLEKVKKGFDDLSGAHELSRGAEPSDELSGEAIDAIQEAGQTRLRLKSRYLDGFLQQIGQKYASRVFQFYSVPQIIRITSEDGHKYFKFHIENMIDEQGKEINDELGNVRKRAVVRNYVQDPKTGKVSEDPNVNQFEINGKFDVRVSTGSSLPFAKDKRSADAFKLYTLEAPPQGGVIDAEELLKAIDYPNAEMILQRMKENQDKQAQAQAAAQAQQQQGKPQGH